MMRPICECGDEPLLLSKCTKVLEGGRPLQLVPDHELEHEAHIARCVHVPVPNRSATLVGAEAHPMDRAGAPPTTQLEMAPPALAGRFEF